MCHHREQGRTASALPHPVSRGAARAWPHKSDDAALLPPKFSTEKKRGRGPTSALERKASVRRTPTAAEASAARRLAFGRSRCPPLPSPSPSRRFRLAPLPAWPDATTNKGQRTPPSSPLRRVAPVRRRPLVAPRRGCAPHPQAKAISRAHTGNAQMKKKNDTDRRARNGRAAASFFFAAAAASPPAGVHGIHRIRAKTRGAFAAARRAMQAILNRGWRAWSPMDSDRKRRASRVSRPCTKKKKCEPEERGTQSVRSARARARARLRGGRGARDVLGVLARQVRARAGSRARGFEALGGEGSGAGERGGGAACGLARRVPSTRGRVGAREGAAASTEAHVEGERRRGWRRQKELQRRGEGGALEEGGRK